MSEWHHYVSGLEFFLSGVLVALSLMLVVYFREMRKHIAIDGSAYMMRMAWFLLALAAWWFLSRVVILGFDAENQRLNLGRTALVLFQIWAELGLLRFLRARRAAQ
jgi:hypothetical protein